jgi:hypothetical protein
MDGVPPYKAMYGVDSDLTARGVWILSNLSTIQSAQLPPLEVGRFVGRRIGEVLKFVEQAVTSSTLLGSPPLFVFAVLGLFRTPWPREHAVDQLFLLMTLALSCVSIVFIYYTSVRFVLLFVPILIIWASNGIWGLAGWACSTLRLLSDRIPRRRWIEATIVVLIAAVIPVVPLRAVPDLYELRTFNKSSLPVKVAGEWLDRYAPGEKTLVDTSTVLAFHAQAAFVPYPYASSEAALQFLNTRRVRFIVVRDGDLGSRPYLNAWMENGVPAPGSSARLIYSSRSPAIGRIQIYEWNQSR